MQQTRPNNSMDTPIIQIEQLSKQYRLGSLGVRTLKEDLSNFWQKYFKKQSIQTLEDSWDDLNRPQQTAAGKKIWALKDLSLKIYPGEVVGIIGKNGAGKSTLLKLISRVTVPTHGEIRLRGKTASLLEVGTGFHPDLTGKENIFLNGAILGMSKRSIEKHFDAIVDFSGVETFINTPIKRYSSGMRLRLAFAVAAFLDAEIVIVDEVLAVGDAVFQKKCIDKMRERAKQGKTVLFVSHQLAVLGALCPRAIWLEKGSLKEDGPSELVLSHYIRSIRNSEGEKKWEQGQGPGDDTLRLLGIRVVNSTGKKSELSVEEAFSIRVDFEVLKRNTQVTCYITLIDKHENLLFQSAPLLSTSQSKDPTLEAPYLEGLYQLQCHIPANLLTDGHYLVNVYLTEGLHHPRATCEREIEFTLHDSPNWHTRYHPNWPGLIRPKLKWEVQPIHSNRL